MSEAKFTPGPYLPGKTVDSIIAESITPKNKPLLMAAPDMYAALRAALCDDPDWRRFAAEAIEKAEGRIGK